MCSEKHSKHLNISPVVLGTVGVVIVTLVVSVLLLAVPGRAQSPSSSQSGSQSQSNPGQQGQMPAEAGGPAGESGPIAVPKKKDTEEAPPPPRPKPSDTPEFSLHVDVPVVTVDARVVQKDGRPIALPVETAKEHFKIWEDGVPQQIQTVTVSKAPITRCCWWNSQPPTTTSCMTR